MKITSNVVQEKSKNNCEKNYTSINGFVWSKKKFDESNVETLRNEFNLDISIAKLAISRGITATNYKNFIEPKLKYLMPDPSVMDDMEKATKKIIEVICKKKKIGILGDYDVDGSCATSLLCSYLLDLGVSYEYHIPDRIKEGYGPNIKALRRLKEKNCDLILTLDCGTTAINSINKISNEDVDVIVVDHHIEAEKSPNAFAIVNPKKRSDKSGLHNLCATGVVFFLLCSLNRVLKKNHFFKSRSYPDLIKYLDLVALATVCDLVKLDQINRTFVKQGIKVLNNTKNIGLSCLIEHSSINQKINEYHLGFILGPRINAGGRVGDSKIGTSLMISKEKKISSILSKKLCDLNNLRKIVEKKVEKDALDQIEENDENIICVHKDDWHPGVLGIVASRLTEKFKKPSIVISEKEMVCTASCRSVKSFDIGKFIINSVNDGKLISGGGHKMAGGFTIEKSKIKDFKRYLKDKFLRKPEDISKNYEFELFISSINNKLFYLIDKFSPFGIGNPKPKFLVKDCSITFPKLVGEKHYSFFLQDSFGNSIKAISFNSKGTEIGKIIEQTSTVNGVIVTITLNRWNGAENVELFVEDIIN